MKFKTFEGPYIKEEQQLSVIMRHLILALLPLVVFTVYKNGYIPYQEGYHDFIYIFYPLLFVLIGMATTYFSEIAYYSLNKQAEQLAMAKKTALLPGLFVALVLPLNTPILVLIFGCLIATFIGKIIFGGFGNNIFNPALIGVLFVTAIFSVTIVDQGGYLNEYELDTISQATPLATEVEGIGDYETLVTPYGDLSNFLFGTIPGSVGETSALLILLAFAYLTMNKMIKWRISVIYVLTVFLMTYLIGTLNDLDVWYPLFHIFSGGLLFGAVFMATDPVTSPTTPVGQILFGLFLGLLTVVFRFLSPYPEGVLTAILTMNLFVFILDKVGQKARFNFSKSTIGFVGAWLLIVVLSLVIAAGFEKEETDDRFQIVNIKEENNQTIYLVEQRAFSGIIRAEVYLENGQIVDFVIVSQVESYWQRIEDANYIEQLLEADDFREVDAVSSATITADALKNILENVWEDYHE